VRQRPPDPQYLKLIAAYPERIRKLALAVRKMVLEEAPEANEFIYEVYTIADHFGFTDRPTEAFVYTSTHANWVNLGFNFGAHLPDPNRLLKGEGKWMRHIRIADPADLDSPGVRELVRTAVADAERPDIPPVEPRIVIHRAKSRKSQTRA